MEEHGAHNLDAAGSSPAPATTRRQARGQRAGYTDEFDGQRRWKGGKLARSQKGRDKRPKPLKVSLADSQVVIDLRRAEFRHLSKTHRRNWKGQLYPIGHPEQAEGPVYPSSHRRVAWRKPHRMLGKREEMRALRKLVPSRAHPKNGVREIRIHVDVPVHDEVVRLAAELDVSLRKFGRLAISAFVSAVHKANAARYARSREDQTRTRAEDFGRRPAVRR